MPTFRGMERRDTHSDGVDLADDQLLPIGTAAKLLGVTVGTVRRWDEAGHIASVRTPGGQRRFRRSEIDRLRAAS